MTTIPNKGAVVVGISEKDVDDIYTIRSYIEGLAAKWATEHITDEEIGALREIVDVQEDDVSRGDSLQVSAPRWSLSRVHVRLLPQSPAQADAFRLSPQYPERQSPVHKDGGQGVKDSVQEHRNILEAIARRDATLAETLTAEHIKNAKKNFLDRHHAEGNN